MIFLHEVLRLSCPPSMDKSRVCVWGRGEEGIEEQSREQMIPLFFIQTSLIYPHGTRSFFFTPSFVCENALNTNSSAHRSRWRTTHSYRSCQCIDSDPSLLDSHPVRVRWSRQGDINSTLNPHLLHPISTSIVEPHLPTIMRSSLLLCLLFIVLVHRTLTLRGLISEGTTRKPHPPQPVCFGS